MNARVVQIRPASRILGFRKLLAFGLTVLCGTVLQAIGMFDPTIAAFLSGSLLLYVGGNVREHAHRAKEVPASPTSPDAARPGEPAPFSDREPGDDTAFDPQRPAVDSETLVKLLADMMANRGQGRRP